MGSRYLDVVAEPVRTAGPCRSTFVRRRHLDQGAQQRPLVPPQTARRGRAVDHCDRVLVVLLGIIGSVAKVSAVSPDCDTKIVSETG
jgi:hypothetical protein